MNLTLHFKRVAFAQVVLGIVAFCMAERNPGLLLIAGAIAALSWYVTEGPGGRPLPRWAISTLSLGAIGWLVYDLAAMQGHVIGAMGHFTMALQILMLYGPKTNRDYAQLLVLSLLQMIGASVLSVSMIFGVLLAAYCVLALVTVLLFQLKNTVDQVHEANRAAAPAGRLVTPPKAVVGRGYRWHFRATALVIGLVCGGFAVTMFVAMPRTGVNYMGTDLTSPVPRQQVGFSQTVKLGTPLNAHATREPVMNLSVMLHGRSLGNASGRGWLLRGAALDRYDRREKRWTRSRHVQSWDSVIHVDDTGVELTELPPQGIVLQGQITLRASNDRTMFTVQPMTRFSSTMATQVRFNPLDQQLVNETTGGGAVVYEIEWPLGAVPGLDQSYMRLYRPAWVPRRDFHGEGTALEGASDYALGWFIQTERVARLAGRVLSDAGLELTADGTVPPKQMVAAASALANFLREEYTYSLQVSGSGTEDPIIDFLFVQKAGHCELFASAHAALCRSVGMPTRVITGYRASEYNSIGGYYVVRQSHAHAWTEVNCPEEGGWRTFDATPPDLVNAEHAPTDAWFAGLRAFYDHLEYSWLRTIVAYDERTRRAVLDDLGDTLTAHAENHSSPLGKTLAFIQDLPSTWRLDKIGYTAAGIVIVMLGVALASLARLLILRRRKLVALQLTAVPRARRRGLTRKLRFYLRMLEMLERHGYVRPVWQSPFQFACELAGREPTRFAPVVALTEVFYEVRFGHRDMDEPRRGRVRENLKALERAVVNRNGR